METDIKILEETKLMTTEIDEEESKKFLREVYKEIIEMIKMYCDIEERYYNIIALWIIGTWFHKQFQTYPYLFLNAMKGSGKTRLLKLIASLSRNGEVLISLSEAVLFRMALDHTFCIDEFEHLGNKEKGILRELLNASYKKGISVKRAFKRKGKDEEKWQIEKFDVFCPIAMANIWGLENVLADRCISIIIEKSDNKKVTRLIEDFEVKPEIAKIKELLSNLCMYVGSVVGVDVYIGWNRYIITRTLQTQQSFPTLLSISPCDKPNMCYKPNMLAMFDKIIETGLEGRHLELFFPLFVLSDICGSFDETLKTAAEIVKVKKQEDIVESRDISLIEYIARQRPDTDDFISLRSICDDMKESEEDWVTPEWCGRALKRLNLIIEKRRRARGVDVRINFAKAREKIKMFHPFTQIEIIKIGEVENDINQSQH